MPMELEFSAKRFEDLSVYELHDLLRLRTDIFVVEQACAYAEIDGRDPACIHILGRDAAGVVIAYARIIPPAESGRPHIGRVVVRKDMRGNGFARELILFTLATLFELYGSMRSELAAQAHLEKFYAGFGFKRIGGEYPWDGIPHVDMVRTADR